MKAHTIGTRNAAGVFRDGGVQGRNAVDVIVHGACETGALVRESGVGATGRTKCTVPAGEAVILRLRDAELAASA